MSSLLFRYTPQTFEDILGQDEAVVTFAAQVKEGGPLPLLVSGPWGTGKTTLARIYARALNCTALTPPLCSPCLTCGPCRTFESSDQVWFFTALNAALYGQEEDAEYIVALARIRPFGAHRRVILLDEAHALSQSAQNALLAVFETPGAAAFVLATTEPEKVSGALRSRCVPVGTRLVAKSRLAAWGAEICENEGIAYESEGLAMLAEASGGHVRDFLLQLGALGDRGVVTRAAVASSLDLDWAAHVVGACDALLTADLAEARRRLDLWRAPATTKAEALRDLFLFVVHVGLAAQHIDDVVNAAFFRVTPEERERLVARVAALAATAGLAPVRYVADLANFWSRHAPGVVDDADLSLRLLDFAHVLHPTGRDLSSWSALKPT